MTNEKVFVSLTKKNVYLGFKQRPPYRPYHVQVFSCMAIFFAQLAKGKNGVRCTTSRHEPKLVP